MKTSFTLIELLIIVGVIAILSAISFTAFHGFQSSSDLENSLEELINTLRLAQQKTIASEGASSWGVYFATSTSPYQYVLFMGASYASRDTSKDEIHKLPSSVIISSINLGGSSEVVFDQVSGISLSQGFVVLALGSDASKTKTAYIGSSGQIGSSLLIIPTDLNRIKDSRHVHIDYSRYISTSTESLILNFYYDSSTQTETIPISINLKNGQISWEGEFNVNGHIQKLKINTHRLNQLDTQISIHRDRRYNNKALKIKFSGDSSGNFIEYSADGLNTSATSIYNTAIQWQ